MRNTSVETESEVWPEIAPLLDTAMAGLNEADHLAVVLRFFDRKSMKEVGAALGASEDAAKMRVSRAVEKLRSFFTRRGIVVPAAVLMAAISANSVQSAPATLAKTAVAVAVAKGATASTPTLTLIKGVLTIMAWTKVKMAIMAGVVLVLVAGTATVVVKSMVRPAPAVANSFAAQSSLDAQVGDSIPRTSPLGAGPAQALSRPGPNARFANLTPEQRVEQARRHFPESVEDLRK